MLDFSAKIYFFPEITKKIAENQKVISKLRNAPSTLSLQSH